MKRHLCATALFALALVPDWAGACWPPGSGPQPVYYAPAYYCPPPVYYYPPPCIPTPPVMVAPPRIEPVKDKGSTRIEPARPIANPNPAPKPLQVEPVRPAAGTDTKPPVPAPAAPPKVEVAPPPAKPEPAPAPAAVEPKREPIIEIPKPAAEPKLPPLELPKTDEPKLPPLELPKTEPSAAPKLPPIELPKIEAPKTDAPKLPDLTGGAAVPSAAPAPDALIPPPNIPNNPGALPPLTLPPDTPVVPEKDAKAKPVEAKSSPLTGAGRELKVSVFPASGTAVVTGLRKVGFYNHTARDLSLTIDGKETKLPAMSYVHAQVPASFTWKCGDRPATKETVPVDAAGVDVLIRE